MTARVRRVSTRAVVLAGVLLALILAGVVSHYASSSPDGLERVAADKGFAHSATRHHAEGKALADYRAPGVDDPRLAGGLAGVTGALVVLVLAGGLVLAVRRRSHPPEEPAGPRTQHSAGS